MRGQLDLLVAPLGSTVDAGDEAGSVQPPEVTVDECIPGFDVVGGVLFRIFHYPPQPPGDDGWGVGEHTDYGLLTLLAQDENAGLQVHTPNHWVPAPPIAGTLVCNIGDMLDRLTGGYDRSTPHRVRNQTGRERLSYPFFFDPDFTAEISPLPGRAADGEGGRPRWDGADAHAFAGTYGDYLLSKVGKVFPDLSARVRQLPSGLRAEPLAKDGF